MGLLQKGWTTLQQEGFLSFCYKSQRYTKNKLINSKLINSPKIRYYNRIAKRKSPFDYYGVLIPTDSDIFDSNVRSRFPQYIYEKNEKDAIDKYIDQPFDVIDLGASTGFLTIYLLKKFNQDVNAVAVEGNPELIPLLERVREMNNVTFDVEDSAYHSSRNSVEFNIHNLTVGGSIQRQTSNTVEIPANSLENILEKYDLGDFICIVDIEGGEADLINNELDTLESNCQMLFVEFHEGYAEGIQRAKHTLNSSTFEMVDNIDGIHVFKNQSI